MGLLRRALLTLAIATTLYSSSYAWENGGKTKNLERPKYGTHDYIAEQGALKLEELLPGETIWLLGENRNAYILGTEAPDNKEVATLFLGATDSQGYGDTFWHHNYYDERGYLIDGKDCASRKAQEEYDKALNAYIRGEYDKAAFYLGAMSHRISDVAAWPHVMGEESMHQEGELVSKHSEFERSVGETITIDDVTGTGTSTIFQEFIQPLSIQDVAQTITAYEATRIVGLVTHRGVYYPPTRMQQYLPMGKRQNGSWVDCSNWNEVYKLETGEALNRAVRFTAIILHKFHEEVQQQITLRAMQGQSSENDGETPTMLLNQIEVQR
ncbi:zinc dependent phospholipase C family protein [Candidatus Woesearchaeota archaeon]|nr:zinc dependent phospholipase C family protein [Candidatus Woesearchaeota archaeon]